MKKPLDVTKAGGDKKGLSIVLEGVDSKLIADITKAIASEVSRSGAKVVAENSLRSPEENVLIANQYLLDVAAAPLSAATFSLMVIIKLRERQTKVRQAVNGGDYAIANTSWLTDAYYYGLRSRSDVSQQIIIDCSFMKPDVWVVFDEDTGDYSKLARQVGIKIIPPNLEKQKIVQEILNLIRIAKKGRKKSQAIAPEIKKPQEITNKLSIYAATAYLNNFHSRLYVSDRTIDTSSYYRPENFGKKVLTAYDIIIKKLLKNYAQAVADLSKHLATQALRNQKPFKVEKLKAEAEEHCRNILPTCCFINLKTDPGTSIAPTEIRPKETGDELSNLLPNIDAEQLSPGVSLLSHNPSNEFGVIEDVLYTELDSSNLAIKRLTDELKYEKKSELLKKIVKNNNEEEALKSVDYTLEVTCEFGQYFDLLTATQNSNVSSQKLSPRYGYEIPKLIEEAGLGELFQQSYDLSLELYSLLQAAGFYTQSSYAALLGHRMRFKLTLNYLELKSLTSSKLATSLKTLCDGMAHQAKDSHPILWDNS